MSEWGATTEYGTLMEVLLCRPDNFRWLPTSAISKATLASGEQFDPDLAHENHVELVDALKGGGVACRYLEPDPALPYQVFARDSSLMTPWGAVITQLHQPWRQGEHVAATDFYLKHEIPIWRQMTAGPLEGGDFMFIDEARALIGACETRTTYEAARQLADWLQAEGIEVRIEPIPERFVHMDVLCCVLAPGLAAVCSEVVSSGLLRWLAASGVTIIEVPPEEAMSLGVNVLAMGGDRIVSAAEATDLNKQMRAHGLEVLDPQLISFTRGGGGAHCLTQALYREGADG